MNSIAPNGFSPSVDDQISENCAAVTAGCADVAGILDSVMRSAERLRNEQEVLAGTISTLEHDQNRVDHASSEARHLSENAMNQLRQASRHITVSLQQITTVFELVEAMAQHVTGFATAMNEVRRTSQDISLIAETTNILALNATIEAAHAGEAGKTFSVVANEVKQLAEDARKATEEISTTVDALSDQAQQVIEQIAEGSQASENAKNTIGSIEKSIRNVSGLVEEVDKQNEQVARSTGLITQRVRDVGTALERFDFEAGENGDRLKIARKQMDDLDIAASDMFYHVVSAGLSGRDSQMVELAHEAAREAAEIAEQAMNRGELSANQLYDQLYVEIPDTNPQLYRTTLSDWADIAWQPFLDKMVARHQAIQICSLSDMNDFYPTHISERSRRPTGEVEHDTIYCRNGRKIFGPLARRIKASAKDEFMCIYRQEDGANKYVIHRLAAVPVMINGQRWGDLHLVYSFD